MHLLGCLIKWLFSFNQLVWFLVGGVVFSSITYFYMKLKQNGKFKKSSFTFIILSALTFAFTIVWAYDSYLENEIRAANMGLLVFGGLTAVFAVVAYRLANKKVINKAKA